MKKILHLAKHYHPHVGGVETHLREVNKLLVKNGYEVTVICFQSDQSEELEETVDQVKVIRIPVSSFYPKFFTFDFLVKTFFKIKLWTWITKNSKLFLKADVIQVHDVFWWVWPLYMAIYYKTYLTFHGWEGRFPVRMRDKIQRYYNSMSAKKTIHVGDFIADFYLDKPNYVIYGGVNSPKKLSEPKCGHKLLSNSSKIIFLGRLEYENEIGNYLELFELIKEQYPQIKITFVGDGSFRDECLEIGEVTGMVADPTDYIQSADFVCANSYLSILEAQSYGKVVISFYSHLLKKSYLSKFPGAKLMLIESSPSKMLKKMIGLNRLDTQKLSKEIRSFAESMTWEKVVDTYKEMWKEAIDER